MAGTNNEACDQSSGTGAGRYDTIGGDGSSLWSFVAAGYGNELEDSEYSFVGGGAFALLSGAAPYNASDGSGVAAGYSDTIASPLSFIGAGRENTIIGSSTASDGDGQSAFIGAGEFNSVSGNFSSIVGGSSNTVAGSYAAISGGASNTAPAEWSSIVGGYGNQTASNDSFIGGGRANLITALNGGLPNGGNYGAIAGGYENSINPSHANGGEFGFIGGGAKNSVTGEWGVVAGGNTNSASGAGAFIGGGGLNVASAADAAIPGGVGNIAAAADTFAAGHASYAKNPGTFVWSDDASGAKQLVSSVANEFLARASGGVTFYSSKNLSTGVHLAAGSGSWSSVSDRAVKTAIVPLDDAAILAKVASLPVSEWSYIAQGTGVRHIGPMAQDFRAAFGVGEDDRHIAEIDEGGVALSAIKALVARTARENTVLRRHIAHQDAAIAELRSEVAALVAQAKHMR